MKMQVLAARVLHRVFVDVVKLVEPPSAAACVVERFVSCRRQCHETCMLDLLLYFNCVVFLSLVHLL